MQEIEKEKEIIDFCSDKKILLEKDAIQILKERDDWKQIIEGLAKENILFINADSIKKKVLKTKINIDSTEIIIKEKSVKAEASELNARFRILDEYDITGKSFSEGKIEDFHKCFLDKFEFLSSILKKKQPLSPKPMSKLKNVQRGAEFDFIGMVSEKWITKHGNIALRLEDTENECIGIINGKDTALIEEKERILLDDVIGIKSRKISDEIVIIKSIYYPDLSMKKPKTIEEDIVFASISDIHVGSKLFLEKEFKKFLDWINLKIDNKKEKEEAGKIKYLFILGDNVEGIGIYPEQYDELSIKDSFEQYKALEDLLMELPEYIEVFIIPGQHDAVRWADPRPAIPKKMMPRLSALKNFHLLGSPSWVEIEGLKILLYHGNSMHDLFANITGMSAAKPNEGSRELLKRRDLMVSFGLSQPYVLEQKNFLLIREEPDFFLTGDIHKLAIDEYRGTTIINNATWQERTKYQISLGHYPTPGIAVSVNLKTRHVAKKVFASEAL